MKNCPGMNDVKLYGCPGVNDVNLYGISQALRLKKDGGIKNDEYRTLYQDAF